MTINFLSINCMQRITLLILIISIIAGCTSQPSVVAPSSLPAEWRDPIPKIEQRSKYGNPPFYEVRGQRYYTLKDSRGYVERGVASWYGPGFHGKRTSSGEPYDMNAMTAAHTTLPLPTYVYVTNLANGRAAILRVNDRGPFEKNRLIDLSYSGAKRLGVDKPGTALVEIQALDPEQPDSWPSGATLIVDAVRAGQSPPMTVAKNHPTNQLTPTIYLQVGAFTDLTNAERLLNRLKNTVAVNCAINKAEVDQETFYRLRLGPLENVETADKLFEPLARLGIYNPHIVVD